MVRLGRGWNPRPVRHQEIKLTPDVANPWKPSVDAFRELVRDPSWNTADINVVLSSHLVRYAVIPGDPNAQTAEEQAELGAIVFRKTFGNLCKDWRITQSSASKNTSTLGVAAPAGLLDALHVSVGRQQTIRSLRPNLMDAFNRIAEPIGRDPAIIVLVETGRITVGQVDDDAWKSIFSRVTSPDDTLGLVKVLAEEAIRCPFSPQAALWIRDLTGTAVVPAELASRVRPIPVAWLESPAAALLA